MTKNSNVGREANILHLLLLQQQQQQSNIVGSISFGLFFCQQLQKKVSIEISFISRTKYFKVIL